MTATTTHLKDPAAASGHVLTSAMEKEHWSKIVGTDAQAALWAGKRPPRLAYERADVLVRATHPGGGTTAGQVHTHDLSAGGMSFLNQSFLHVGTALSVTLPRRLLGEEVVSGRVAWCRHVSGTWHAVGVRFDDPISPKQFVSPAEWDRLPTSNPIKPQSLTGQVLMIDDQDVDQMLFAHLLRSTRLSVTTVGDVARAVEAIGKLVFDVVCLDLNLGVGRPGGEDAIATLRSAGHKGPIVAVSGVQASRLEAARSRGVAHTLAKPYDTDQLIAVLAAALEVNGGEPADPIYSELSHQEGVADLLQAFCDKVRQSMRQFRLHVDAGRLDDVRMVCEMLRGSAGGYGYPSLSAAAGQAIKAIDACGDVAEASPDLLKLIALSKRITPSKKPRATAA